MTLKRTGVELVAEEATRFYADIDKANKVVTDFGRDAEKASGGLGKFGGALLDMAKVAGGQIIADLAVKGFGALSGAIQGGIGDAREAAKINAQTEQTIKSMGNAAGVSAQHVQDFAASLSAANGQSLFGDSQYQESTNLLLTFQNIKGATLDLATTLTGDLAQALGGAPADQALMLGKALDNPTQGMSALTRVGLTFTEQQKAQITTMQATGDMAGAQAVIIAALNAQVGGSAAAAAAADGGMAQFKDRMGELGESIGAQVLPLLNQFMAWLNSPEIQTAITTIGTNLVAAVVAAAAGFTSFMTTIQPVTSFISDNLIPILASIAAMALTVIVPAVLGMIPVFIGWATAAGAAAVATIAALLPVVAPIAAIGLAIGLLVKAWDSDWGGMRTTLTTWWDGTVQPILKTVEEWIGTKLTAAIAVLQAAWEVAWPLIKAAVETVYTWLSVTVWPWLVTAFNTVKDTVLPALGTAFSTVWAGIQTAVDTTWAFLRDTVFPALTTGMDLVGTAAGVLQAAFSVAWTGIQTAAQTASGIVDGVINTITGAVNRAIDAINGLIDLINNIPGVPDIPNLLSFGGGKAAGGRVERGTSYVVGEHGPEMFVPQQSGMIVPNHRISPPASASQMMAASYSTVNAPVNYNWSPTYHNASREPSQDFHIMQALSR